MWGLLFLHFFSAFVFAFFSSFFIFFLAFFFFFGGGGGGSLFWGFCTGVSLNIHSTIC